MATAKTKRKGARKPGPVRTSSFAGSIEALTSGKEVVLVEETLKRDEVRISPATLVQYAQFGKFGFIAYRSAFVGSTRIRSFVDDQDIGVEHQTVASALVHAVAHQSLSDNNPEFVPILAGAACRVLGLSHH